MDLIAQALSVAGGQLAGALPQRWAHVQGVADKADRASALMEPDERQVLKSSALLHDIGYAPDLVSTGFHSLDGATYLRMRKFPERVCSLVAHHSCAYREAELRGLSGELNQWGDEKTVLRDVLWWADMTTTPEGQPTSVHARIDEIRQRYGPDDLVTRFIHQAGPELIAAVERTEERLRAAGLGHLAK